MIKKQPIKKVITRLKGGLGNQMFIYATAYRLAQKNNATLLLDKKTGFEFDHKYKRTFNLEFLNISAETATNKDLLFPFFRIRRFIYRFLSFINIPTNKEFYFQNGLIFDHEFLNLKIKSDVLYFDGFGQGEEYFLDVKDHIKREFGFKYSKTIKNFAIKNLQKNSVAIHFRFFDSSNYDSPLNLKDDYYKMAISEICSKISNPVFYIFSDNLKFAKKRIKLIFTNQSYVLVDNFKKPNIPQFDFQLMSCCKHFIIANSSYSWWASWLGERKDSYVYVPGIMLNEQNITSWSFDKLIPERWNIL